MHAPMGVPNRLWSCGAAAGARATRRRMRHRQARSADRPGVGSAWWRAARRCRAATIYTQCVDNRVDYGTVSERLRRDATVTTPEDGFSAVWNRALEALDAAGVTPQQRAFVRLTRPVGLLDGTALLAAPNDLTKEVLEQRMREVIVQALSAELGQPVRLAVTVDSSIVQPMTPVPRGDQGALPGFEGRDVDGAQGPRPSPRPNQDALSPTAVGDPAAPAVDSSAVGATEEAGSGTGDDLARPAYPRPADDAPGYLDTPGPVRPSPVRPGTGRAPGRPAGRGTGPAQPEVHLRDLRHRRQQPVRARRRGRRRRGAGQGLQPAVHLRRLRAGQDPPAARHRPLRAQPLPGRPGALRELRGVHQRLHQQHPRRQGQRASSAATATSTCCSSTTSSSSQGKVQTQEEFFHTFNTLHNANKQVVITSRPAAQAARRLRGADAVPVRVGPDHRRPAARPRDPHRHPAQEGHRRAAAGAATTSSSTSPRKISTNIRELEGALIRVTAFASLNRQQVDLSLAEIVLQGPDPRRRHAGDHRRHDHGADGRLLQPDHRRPLRLRPGPGCSSTPGRSRCTCAAS